MPLKFDTLYSEDEVIYKEFNYTPNLRRPISIIDPETTEEIAELRKAREQTIQDMKAEKKRRKMKQENTFIQSDEEIDFFGSDDNNTFGQK